MSPIWRDNILLSNSIVVNIYSNVTLLKAGRSIEANFRLKFNVPTLAIISRIVGGIAEFGYVL